MKYVMSDIHGHFDKFMRILERINFSDNDELYILGDVIDRGDKPIEALKYILSKNNMYLIRGNHEEMMLNSFSFCEDEVCPTIISKDWIANGGLVTAEQFLELPLQEQIDLLSTLSNLPYYIIKDNIIFVHAGIYCEDNSFEFINDRFTINKFMDTIDKDILIWDREMVYSDFEIKGYHIYCGHTPIPYLFPNENTIYKTNGYTLIDCGVYFEKGQLACYCIDNDTVIYE